MTREADRRKHCVRDKRQQKNSSNANVNFMVQLLCTYTYNATYMTDVLKNGTYFKSIRKSETYFITSGKGPVVDVHTK